MEIRKVDFREACWTRSDKAALIALYPLFFTDMIVAGLLLSGAEELGWAIGITGTVSLSLTYGLLVLVAPRLRASYTIFREHVVAVMKCREDERILKTACRPAHTAKEPAKAHPEKCRKWDALPEEPTKLVSTREWLRGGGNPSVFRIASLMAESDRLAAELDEIVNGKRANSAVPMWLRTGLYTFLFLLIRWVVVSVLYALAIVIVVMLFSYVVFG